MNTERTPKKGRRMMQRAEIKKIGNKGREMKPFMQKCEVEINHHSARPSTR